LSHPAPAARPLFDLPALDTKTMALAGIGATFVQLPVTTTLSRLVGFDPFGPNANPVTFLLIYLIVPGIASLCWIWFFAVWREFGGWRRVGLGPPAVGWLRPALLTGAGALLLSILVLQVSLPIFGQPKGFPLGLLPGDPEAGFVYSMLFFVGVVGTAPLIEEIIYRGVLHGWLRRRLPWFISAIAAAMIHGFIHFDPAATPSLIAVFILFALLYEKTGTLWAPVTAHAIYNFLNLVAYFILPTML
jgi:membrane protease YdiL (CAAX protease family)